ncbi:hypothetical protein PanWU01x14_258040 [Parasponia andersonii]|uniref:Uncharacterized protein n=1 Tax=Parasponia andersonii TaxID=3476 RepID=A0A2P5B9W8_PARAD|nr:hypothetical protein PanWU01x14_258040 [Parasponia andersonii]
MLKLSVMKMFYVKLDGFVAFKKIIEGFNEDKRLSRSAFSSSSTTSSNFLLSTHLLLMCLPSRGHPCIVEKSESHKIESLVVNLISIDQGLYSASSMVGILKCWKM